jgi:hypothetical protein
MLLENQDCFRFYSNELILHLQLMMQQKTEDVYQLQLILFSAKNNEFDH